MIVVFKYRTHDNDLIDQLISFWTRSRFIHSQILFTNGQVGSSWMDTGVAFKTRRATMIYPFLYEYVQIPNGQIDEQATYGYIEKRLGEKFDMKGAIMATAAANLSDEIETALQESRFLVVICSPAAARSKWVNQEIIRYKAIHGEGRILAAIVDGEPFAADIPGQEDQECFPEALKFRIDSNGALTDERAEPIAADLRPGGDGKKYGRSKIAAGLLGVRLDDVIRREAQRRNARMGIVAASASLIAACMGILAYATILARDEARTQRAEAEDLIEFMLSDLRERLEVVGRLDVLDAVGQEAIEYYSKIKRGSRIGGKIH